VVVYVGGDKEKFYLVDLEVDGRVALILILGRYILK
jgi:hypothetical protein